MEYKTEMVLILGNGRFCGRIDQSPVNRKIVVNHVLHSKESKAKSRNEVKEYENSAGLVSEANQVIGLKN